MKFFPVAAVLGTAAALAGCSTSLDGFGTKASVAEQPKVLSAPTAAVESAPVPPPAVASAVPPAPSVTGSTAATAGAAVTPRTTASNVPLTPPPAATNGNAFAASPLKDQLSGPWTFAWDGGQHSCPVTLTTDKGLNGLSARADVSCPSEIFMTKGWDLMGSDIVLQDHVGKVTARLQPTGPDRYSGVLSDNNQPITMVR